MPKTEKWPFRQDSALASLTHQFPWVPSTLKTYHAQKECPFYANNCQIVSKIELKYEPHWDTLGGRQGSKVGPNLCQGSVQHEKWWPPFQSPMTSEVRSDLIRSPIFGGAQQLLFYEFFWFNPPFAHNSYSSVLAIKWVPLLGTPIKKLSPYDRPHWTRGAHAKIWEESVQWCGLVSGYTQIQTNTHNNWCGWYFCSKKLVSSW